MAINYLWSPTQSAEIGSCTSLGTSWILQSVSQSFSGPAPRFGTVYGTGIIDLGQSVALAGWSFDISWNQSFDGGAQLDPAGLTVLIQTSPDGASWTTRATVSNLVSGSSHQLSGAFSGVTARHVRFLKSAEGASVFGGDSGILTVSITVTDIAVTFSPPVPTGLAVTDQCGPLTFSWDAVSGATGYRLKRTDTDVVLYDGAATSFSISGLALGTARTVAVSAYNGTGTSAYSEAVTGTQGGLPFGLTLSQTPDYSTGDVSLSWSGSATPAITSWTLKRGATTIYTGTLTTFNDTARDPEAAATYTLIATNACGDTQTTLASPPIWAPPATPTGFTVTTDCETGVDILEWDTTTAQPPITRWEIHDGAGNLLVAHAFGVLTTVLSREGRLEGRIYELSGVNAVGASPRVVAASDHCSAVTAEPDIWVHAVRLDPRNGWRPS